MAEPLRTYPQHTIDPRPELAAVPDLGDERRVSVGRWALTGAAVGFVVVTAVLTIGVAVRGLGVAAGLGLGVAVGLFGGAGFGCMMGSVLALVRLEAEEERAAG